MLKSCSWSLFALRCVLTVEQRTPAGQASPMECFSVLTARGPTGPLAFTWVSFGKYLVSFDSKSHLLIVLFVHIPAQRGKPILPSASDWNLLSVCFAFAVSDGFLGIVFNLPAVLPEAAHCGGTWVLPFQAKLFSDSGTWVVLGQTAGAVNLHPDLVPFQVSVPAAASGPFGVW